MKLYKSCLVLIHLIILTGAGSLKGQLLTEWVRVLRVDSSEFSITTGITADKNFNSFITGMVRFPSSGNDMILAKYSPTGDLMWCRYTDGGSGANDSATAVCTDYQNNPVIAGKSCSDTSGFDFLITKYDTAGNMLWSREWSSPGITDDIPRFVKSDGTGNIYAGGYTQYGDNACIRIIKYSKSGGIVYEYTYSGPGQLDYIEDMYISNSGYAYIAGRSLGTGTSYEYLAVKINPTGQESWVRKYNRGPWYDVASRITADAEGNVYLTGGSMNGDAGRSTYDIYTIKYDQNGNEVFSYNFDSPDHGFDFPMGIVVDEYNNTWVGGITEKSDGNLNWVIFKLPYWGWTTPEWVRYFDGSASSLDSMTSLSIFEETDNSFTIIASGYTTSINTGLDFITIKYTQDGAVRGIAKLDNGSMCDRQTAAAIDRSGKIYLTGFCSSEDDSCLIETAKFSQFEVQSAYNYSLVDSVSGAYYLRNSAAYGNYLIALKQYDYVPAFDSRKIFGLYDISDPASLRFIDTLDILKTGDLVQGEMLVSDSLLFLTQSQQGLFIYNFSDPFHPFLLSRLESTSNNYYELIATRGDKLFISDWNQVRIIDISDPAYPFETGMISIGSTRISDIQIQGDYLFVNKAFDLFILDISNPSFPVIVSSVQNNMYDAPLVIPAGDLAYSLESSNGFDLSISTIDISDPADPVVLSYSELTGCGFLRHWLLKDQYIFLIGSTEIRVLDRTDPLHLTEYGFFRLSGYDENHMAVIDGNALIVGYTDGIYSISDEVMNIIPEFITLSVTASENGAEIKWLMNNVTRIRRFGVEKRGSIREWHSIGEFNVNTIKESAGDFLFYDPNVENGVSYYRIKAEYEDGSVSFSPEIELNLFADVQFRLCNNYPNPFNPSTTISYSLPSQSKVSLRIYGINGEEIMTAVEEFQLLGTYSIKIDMSAYPSGIYLARLQAGKFHSTIKMLFLK